MKQALIDGTITAYIATITGANGIWAALCSPSFTSAFSIASYVTSLGTRLTGCVISLVILAVLDYIGHFLYQMKGQPWVWDDHSGAARRAAPLLASNASDYWVHENYPGNGAWLSDNVYQHKPDSHPDWFAQAMADAGLNNSQVVYTGSMFVFDNSTSIVKRGADDASDIHTFAFMNHVNGSVAGDSAGIIDALRTYAEYDGITETFSRNTPWVNTTMHKRDDAGGAWASYNDWGLNPGYVQDLVDWGEFYKGQGFADAASDTVNHFQPCEQQQCYSEASKYCFGVGFTPQAGKESAMLGEIYNYGYGGVDGQCYNL